MTAGEPTTFIRQSFSALQRAEIAEISGSPMHWWKPVRFSALQRAEIAEIVVYYERNINS